MCGHVCLPYMMTLKNLTRPIWPVQAGTAVSTRVRPGVPNAVNVLLGPGLDTGPLPNRTVGLLGCETGLCLGQGNRSLARQAMNLTAPHFEESGPRPTAV